MSTWEEVCDKRFGPHGYASLTDEEKIWFNVGALTILVGNGGLISYFYNSGADTLQDCYSALEELGALDVKSNLQRVALLFGNIVPSSMDERSEIIASWGDESHEIDRVLEETDRNFFLLLPDLEVRLDSFLRSRGLAA